MQMDCLEIIFVYLSSRTQMVQKPPKNQHIVDCSPAKQLAGKLLKDTMTKFLDLRKMKDVARIRQKIITNDANAY